MLMGYIILHRYAHGIYAHGYIAWNVLILLPQINDLEIRKESSSIIRWSDVAEMRVIRGQPIMYKLPGYKLAIPENIGKKVPI